MQTRTERKRREYLYYGVQGESCTTALQCGFLFAISDLFL
jgi:hypothetical protein